jgi:CheY-like chemotaxis protein
MLRPPELRGLRVLVVEDTALVAAVISGELEACGVTVVGPATRLPSAMALAHEEALDAALLDVNLEGDASFPIVKELARRDIPVIFVTAYDNPSMFPPEYRDYPRVTKPFDERELMKVLAKVVKPETRH